MKNDKTNSPFIDINICKFTDLIMQYSHSEKASAEEIEQIHNEIVVLAGALTEPPAIESNPRYQKFNEILEQIATSRPEWLDLSVFEARK